MNRLLTILLLTASLSGAESLDSLLRTAELNNPEILAAQNKWMAARERIRMAGALPDPRISYGHYLEEIQTRTGPQQQRASISQMLPLFGKRGLSESAAASIAEAALARFRAVRASILFQLKKNIFDLHYTERAIETEALRKNLILSLQDSVERAVENGGDARDLLNIRIALQRTDDARLSLEAKKEVLLADLNALLNREPESPFILPDSLPLSELHDQSEAQHLFRQENPAIKEQNALLTQRQAEQQRAQRNWIPDLTIGADWIQTGDGGDDPLIANVSINLPLWHSKNKAEQLSATLEQTAQEHHLENQILSARTQLSRFFIQRNEHSRRIALYTDTLVPAAEQHLELTRTAYETGTETLRELIDSEDRLFQMILQLERAQTDRAIVNAEIEKLTGGPIL